MPEPRPTGTKAFHGWRVAAGAFGIATLGWGLGFYGPPIYLHQVTVARGWPVGLVSAAVTAHFLCGALVVAGLPRLYRRFGLAFVTRAGAVALAAGLIGWATAAEPWQLFAAALLSGCGWVTLGAAAINAMIAPWFVRLRPKALSTAYNGASVGGIVFAPLWVALIARLDFAGAAVLIGLAMLPLVWWLTGIVAVTPSERGQHPDGDAASAGPIPGLAPSDATPLRRDRRFFTLAAAMALGLFAQIGVLAHLFSLVVPAFGEGGAGVLSALATAAAILGRTIVGWALPPSADRRLAAAASYSIQIGGLALLLASGLHSPALVVAGVLLFGFGIGNATSLQPLIAQVEFAKETAARVVPLIVATAQAVYAFAPALFGLLRDWPSAGASAVLTAAIVVKLMAVAALQLGRGIGRHEP
jgi:hypothetical protein